MKDSSRQFGDQLSGFGRQSEKCSRIGACIRRNFTPCNKEQFVMVCHGKVVVSTKFQFSGRCLKLFHF